ncbi:hypothetical protein [Formosa sp. A9]|uniref:hypothetical protein n=1 Tax=Formosa sp. A9 TaxID=3442641 RepID=UPI003EC05EB4
MTLSKDLILITMDNIAEEVRTLIYNHPFSVDEHVTYRVYADKHLDLGYIMDTEQKLLKGYSYKVKRERYLLETVNTNIDGPNWLKALEGLDLNPVKG